MKILDALKTVALKKEKTPPRSLKTPWTNRVRRENVWPEYPRPQMIRDSFINLNGLWEYSMTDPSHPKDSPLRGKILVPFSPEAPLSGVGKQLLPGQVLQYRRRFTLDQIPETMRLLLHFGAVDERCTVRINGQEAGRHCGGYLPFYFDITKWIQPGENTLTVSCRDDSDTSFHPRGKQMLNRGGMFYTAQSGIWQTVWMEWVPDTSVEDIRLTPDFDQGLLHVKLSVVSRGKAIPNDILYQANVTANGQMIAELSTDSPEFSLVIPDFIPWTPENPFLYDLKLTLHDGDKPIDAVSSYFAMRCVSVERDPEGIARLCLNHMPYFQNGVLDQGYWPDGLYTAPCDDAMIYDILAMKRTGFNLLRKHCKVEPLRWYYHCDRLGMLVWQDMVNGGSPYDMLQVCYLPTLLPPYGAGSCDKAKAAGRTSQKGRREWYRECAGTIRHLYNSPCVVSWVLFNEGWGQFDAEQATAFARQLDCTRLIDQASGWFDHRGGDMRSVHNYFRELVCPEVNTSAGDTKDSSASPNRCGLRAAVISEYGGLALPLPGHTATGQVYGYRNLRSSEEFRRRFTDLQKRVRELEKQGLSAAVYTQVSDIEDEVNGILTYDRIVNKLVD